MNSIIVNILQPTAYLHQLPKIKTVQLMLVDKIPGFLIEWIIRDDVLDFADVLQLQQGFESCVAHEDGSDEGLIEAEGEVFNAESVVEWN